MITWLLAIFVLLVGCAHKHTTQSTHSFQDQESDIVTASRQPAGSLGRSAESASGSIDPSGLDGAAQFFLSSLPEGNIKRGLKRYLEVVGLDAYTDANPGQANHGLNRFISEQVTKNWCYGKLASQFAKEQYNLDDELWRKYENQIQNRPLKARMSLADVAGQSVRELEPGWLWQKALRFSGQDKNLAVSLIGVCGHDDTGQGPYEFWDRSAEGMSLAAKSENPELRKLGLNTEVYCPQRASFMFLPQSLGKEWDISPKLKNKISQIQNPSQGARGMPAKYYHVYGSAFATCQMIQEGMPAGLAEAIQVEASRFYRGIRLCGKVNSLSEKRARLLSEYQNYKSRSVLAVPKQTAPRPLTNTKLGEFLTFDQWLLSRALELQKDSLCTPPAFPEQILMNPSLREPLSSEQVLADFEKRLNEWKRLHEKRCSLIDPIVRPADLAKLSSFELGQKVEAFLSDLNASDLYSRWFLGSQKIGKIQIPCTDIQLFGPGQIFPSDLKSARNVCGFDYSTQACNKARQRLAAWSTDFEWTAEQHRIGAQFAIRHCAPERAGETPEARSCRALEQAPAVEERELRFLPDGSVKASP